MVKESKVKKKKGISLSDSQRNNSTGHYNFSTEEFSLLAILIWLINLKRIK